LAQCPNCMGAMEANAAVCPLCGLPVDWKSVQEAKALQSLTGKACRSAGHLKISAAALIACYLLHFLPIIDIPAIVGLLVLLVILPGWSLRWWEKYSKIESTNPEFTKARKTVKMVGLLVAAMTLILFALQIYQTASTVRF